MSTIYLKIVGANSYFIPTKIQMVMLKKECGITIMN